MSGIAEGQSHENRSIANPMYLRTGDPGMSGGGTYTGSNTQPTLEQYENIFGPAARDIKVDQQRHKRHQRWHLPDALKGSNQYLTDRIDGLITDATNSPFTRNILPYVYLENPDQKIKWNVYSFDEGIASRVPYESAARVLPQTKRSFAGYTVRQGLAIAMEHNFMVSAAGRENFKNQLTQLVGSIQMTNDLDVHVALLSAPSYQKHMNEKYYDTTKTTAQSCRQYIDLFGIMQKVPNALDILIEDAKNHLKTWGSAPPTFLLCNGALTAQMTMLPEKTNYLTNGPDGAARLAQGPELPSYRGLNIIHSRKFSMDAGTAPRDLLRRRVRVAEYYRIPWSPQNKNRMYEFYDQSRDTMFRISWNDLCKMADIGSGGMPGEEDDELPYLEQGNFWKHVEGRQPPQAWNYEKGVSTSPPTFLRIHSNVGNTDFQDTTGAIQALFAALGVPSDVFYKKTSLLWPRTVEPQRRNGEPLQRRKLPIEMLVDTDCVSEEFHAVSMSNAMIQQNMEYCDELKLKHHKMSETNPVINDHIVSSKYDNLTFRRHAGNINLHDQPTLMANFDSLQLAQLYEGAAAMNRYGHNTELAHCFGNAKLFLGEINTAGYNSYEEIIMTNSFHLCECEVLTAVNALRDVCEDLNMNMNGEGVPAGAGATANTRAWIADDGSTFARGGGPAVAGLTHELTNANASIVKLWEDIFHHRRRDITLNTATPVGPNNGGTIPYKNLLLAWRREYWYNVFKSIPNFQQSNTQNGPETVPPNVKTMHHVHTNELSKVRNMILLNILEEKINTSAGGGITDWFDTADTRAEFKDHREKFNSGDHNVISTFAYNIYNKRKRGQGIYAPNLHISRCHPLKQEHEELSASSMDKHYWLLQQLAGMMPLTNQMCRILTSAPDLQPANTANCSLLNEYAKFWHGTEINANPNPTFDGSDEHMERAMHFNTFLMHWYMSEFHPLAHIREAAKNILGMNADRHGVTDFLHCFADCLTNNTTLHNAKRMQDAFVHMQPNMFTYFDDVMVSTAVAEKECAYVTPFCTSQKDPIFHHVPWNEMPVAKNDENVKCDTGKMNAGDFHGGDGNVNWVEQNLQLTKFYDATKRQVIDMSTNTNYKHSEHYNKWMRKIVGFCDHMTHLRYHMEMDPSKNNPNNAKTNIFDPDEEYYFKSAADYMAQLCMSEDAKTQDYILRHIVMVFANRFWKPTTRAMNNGQGLAIYKESDGKPGYYFSGSHLMHGPEVPTIDAIGDGDGGVPQDLLILRPNIEHEMLGIIMGRGGTQELGATFWGQTELSCYDDAQHGIWGMSYKYHERAMVTNERNLIRVYDVAFDGYNGGMDQRHVNWNDQRSMDEFREATFDKTRAYNGPSMLVMGLPHDSDRSSRAWPNPIIFTPEVLGNISLSPEKEQPPSDAKQHMIFNCAENAYYCNEAQASKFKLYMQKLGMEHWSTVDQANRPAGECCIGNETSAHMFAFEGTMKVLDKHSGALIDATQGSGHLGPSFVGVASIREGRGIQNANMQPSLHRLI